MAIIKPYKRIIRPFKGMPEDYENYNIRESHLMDSRYASDKVELISAIRLLEKDLVRIFEYVEPTDRNKGTFSHRLYEILLRTCTEFETNCKRILSNNAYVKLDSKNRITDRWNIEDYWKINKSSKLSEYEVRVSTWSTPKIIKPFESWHSTSEYVPLGWYQAYNDVKHNRSDKFELANIENVVMAISGVLVVLFSQFFASTFGDVHYMFEESGGIYWHSGSNSIFLIKTPQSWKDEEQYDFDWTTLMTDANPFDDFRF
jgi:hypothetical protein